MYISTLYVVHPTTDGIHPISVPTNNLPPVSVLGGCGFSAKESMPEVVLNKKSWPGYARG